VSLPSFITREVLVLRRTPTPAQIELLRPRVQRARRVCIDYTGAGIGLDDALAQEFGGGARLHPSQHSPTGKVELCTFTAGLKEEIFIKLRAAFERRSIFIPRSSDIREDLHSVHRVVSNSGHISFRASRTADGHSDRCTALALALRAATSAPLIACAAAIGRKLPMYGGTPYIRRRSTYY
jgi:phage FluMu gp28-like protein